MSDTKNDLPKNEIDEEKHSSDGQVVNALIKRLGDSLTIQDPDSGKTITLKIAVVEDETDVEEPKEFRPIPVEEFKSVLQKIDQLGLCWTADVIPAVRAKEGISSDPLSDPEFLEITQQYPHLPVELSSFTRALLTGGVRMGEAANSENEFYKKAAVVQEFVISPRFKHEFFFKNSIKVPYFTDLDWEVVIKAYERNVGVRPDVIYGLISLAFIKSDSSNPWNPKPPRQAITVAVDEKLVDKIIESLNDLKEALQKAREDLKSIQAAG